MHLSEMIIFVLVGLLFIGLAIPLILRKVPPNYYYGTRVPKTLGNPDIWYQANEYSGKLLAIVGGVIVLAALGLGLLALPREVYALCMTLVMLIAVIITTTLTLLYVKRL